MACMSCDRVEEIIYSDALKDLVNAKSFSGADAIVPAAQMLQDTGRMCGFDGLVRVLSSVLRHERTGLSV